MLILGHPLLPSETLYHIDGIEAIDSTPPNTLLFFDYSDTNRDILAHCIDNSLPFALSVASVKEGLFAENLGARYIVVELPLAKSVQKVAETYLFDAKVLARIDDEAQIEAMAFEGIDGVVFAEAIVKITG